MLRLSSTSRKKRMNQNAEDPAINETLEVVIDGGSQSFVYTEIPEGATLLIQNSQDQRSQSMLATIRW